MRLGPALALVLWAPLLLQFGGCAAPPVPVAAPAPPPPPPPAPKKSVFVLLPDASGRAGQITVSTPGGSQVLDQPYQSTSVGSPAQPPSASTLLDPEKVRETFGAALAAEPRAPARFNLYFQWNSDQLTAESVQLVPAILQAIRERAPAEVSVVGHTDTMGARQYNYELGLRRARQMVGVLAAGGIDPSMVMVSSHGEDNPLIPTADERLEPRNRRVEVTVR